MSAEPSRSAAPRLSAEDFWRLLAKSELLAADRLVALRVGFDKVAPAPTEADARSLAKWLIGQKAITRYHAQALLAGQIGPFRFGDYIVLEPIEAGILAGQFRGRSLTTHQDVLLRFVTGKDLRRPEVVGRLRETLATWRRVAGPGLVVGSEWLENGPYKLFVTDAYGGESLAERLKLLRVFPADRACQFVAQMASAIAGLHREGIAHSSLRTDAATVDKSGAIKLLGFPLVGDPLAAAHVVADSPSATAYDAPELRLPPCQRTPLSDVYALGAVLYELLAGQPPQIAPALIPADQINPAVPEALSAVIARCLSENPDARPANATEVARLLAPWTGEAPANDFAVRNAPTDDSPRVEIQTSDSPTIQTVAKPRRRSSASNLGFSAIGVGVVLLTLLGAWWTGYFTDESADAPRKSVVITEDPTTSASPPDEAVAATDSSSTDGAQGYGEALWERPFAAKPWNLAYVPSGAQMIAVLRPQALLQSADGEKLAALPGPVGEWLTKTLPALTGFELAKIERLTLAFAEEPNGGLPVVAVVRLSVPISAEEFGKLYEAPTSDPPAGFAARVDGDRLLLRPNAGGDSSTTIICLPAANQDLIADLAESHGAQPNLRPQFEALLPFTSEEAELSVLAAPSFLYETLPQHADPAAKPVWALLETWLGRDSRGVLASASLQPELFCEVRVIGGDLVKPRAIADAWRQHLDVAPQSMSEYLKTRALQPYSRSVLLQFGQMLQVLAAYTRLGEEHGQLVARCVLPEGAAHNLYLAGYLAAREPAIGESAVVATPPAAPAKEGLAELLKKPTSLSFPNNSLETSLQLLGEDLGFRVHIEGNDLKIEGITKNQAIRNLDEQNRPAQEILRNILKKADPAGRLVYLPKRDPATGEEILVITTRAAAAQRGETLPPELSQP